MAGTVFVISLGLNVLFFGIVLLFWLQRIRIFHRVIHEIDTRAAMTFFDAYPVSPGDIVFLGDSITAGGHWAEMFPDHSVRNRGISGDRTEDLLSRLDQITAGRPAKVFLLIGTNDIGLGVPREETVRNYRAILDQLTQGSPETRIYVQSVLPREAKASEDVVSLNADIAVMAADRNLTYLDLFAAFTNSAGAIRKAYSYDGLHLSGSGYQRWQSLLAPYVYESVAHLPVAE